MVIFGALVKANLRYSIILGLDHVHLLSFTDEVHDVRSRHGRYLHQPNKLATWSIESFLRYHGLMEAERQYGLNDI